MAASAATSGFNTLWQDNTTGSFATVAEVRSISGPGLDLNMIDVTNLTSPSEWEEVIAGILRTKAATLDLNFLPGNQSQRNILAAIQNRTKVSFKIIWPDAGATTWTFSGFYQTLEPSAPHDNRLSMRVGVKVTGAITIPT